MFLDEPTSGLDSGSAFNIVRFLRKLADAGQAVLCAIHQPSAASFEHSDELIPAQVRGRHHLARFWYILRRHSLQLWRDILLPPRYDLQEGIP